MAWSNATPNNPNKTLTHANPNTPTHNIITRLCWVSFLDPTYTYLSASKSEMLWRIMFPAVVGHILTGLRLAIGIVWVVLVPCEMLGVNEGLGYFILDTRDRLAYSELMAAIVLIGMIGWALDSLARWLGQTWKH